MAGTATSFVEDLDSVGCSKKIWNRPTGLLLLGQDPERWVNSDKYCWEAAEVLFLVSLVANAEHARSLAMWNCERMYKVYMEGQESSVAGKVCERLQRAEVTRDVGAW